MTELQAQLAWKEQVSFYMINPTDIELTLRVVFREKKNGKL